MCPQNRPKVYAVAFRITVLGCDPMIVGFTYNNAINAKTVKVVSWIPSRDKVYSTHLYLF